MMERRLPAPRARPMEPPARIRSSSAPEDERQVVATPGITAFNAQRTSRKADRSDRALARLAVQAHRPAKAFAQAPHDRQAHAAPFLPGGVGAVERIEYL